MNDYELLISLLTERVDKTVPIADIERCAPSCLAEVEAAQAAQTEVET